MSFALTVSSLIAPLVLGAPPAPCPAGQVPAPATTESVAGDTEGAALACVTLGELVAGPAKASPEEIAGYAELEQKTPAEVSEFRGGSVAVYVSTGAAIVLVVVLLLILL